MGYLNLLNQSCSIQGRTTTVGSMGEAIISYATTATSACYIEVASFVYGRVDGRDGVRATHLAFLPKGVPVDTSCQLTCEGRVYSVVSVESPRGHHLEVGLTLNSSPQKEP